MPDSSGIAGLQQQLGSAFSNLRQQTGSAAPAQLPARSYQAMEQQATQQAPDAAYQRMLAQALNGKAYDTLFPKAAAPAPLAAAPAYVPPAPEPAATDASPAPNYGWNTEMLGGGGDGAGSSGGASSGGDSGASSGGAGAYRRGGLVPPTEAQKHAGNYQKHHIRFHGLPISIENPKGSVRSGKGWRCVMPADYGYIKGTEGADGDHLDVFIGPDKHSQMVFVINQLDHKTGRFDEHKAMMAYASERAAVADYKKAFSDGKGADRIGSVEPMSLDAFKHWLKRGRTKTPAKSKTIVEHALAMTRRP